MGVDFNICKICQLVYSKYDDIYCDNCENSYCGECVKNDYEYCDNCKNSYCCDCVKKFDKIKHKECFKCDVNISHTYCLLCLSHIDKEIKETLILMIEEQINDRKYFLDKIKNKE
jgi:hypothetical protein